MEHGQVAMLGDFIWPIIMQNNTSSLCSQVAKRNRNLTSNAADSADVIMWWLRLRLDGRSTAYQRSLNKVRVTRNPLVTVTLTYLFIYAAVEQPWHNK